MKTNATVTNTVDLDTASSVGVRCTNIDDGTAVLKDMKVTAVRVS